MHRAQIKRRPLSDTVLANLKPESREYREHDGGGLYFRVQPNGNKSWTLRYKTPEGKWSWIGLGKYPAVSSDMARRKASELRQRAYHGEKITGSSRANKKALDEAKENTFESLSLEWLNFHQKQWTSGTYIRVKGRLEKHVYPSMGKRPFADIHPMDWMGLFREMESAGILEQLRNVRSHCKNIYDLARVTGRMTHNPVDGLERFLRPSNTNNYAHVAPDELPNLLRAINAYPYALDVKLGLRLLILTASRPSEVRESRWEEFDFESALWTIPAERMKKRRDHLVPLSQQALEILIELRSVTGAYQLLFPGRNNQNKPRSNMAFIMALRRLGYEGRQTGHGFRHIASTVLRENGFHQDYVEAQLSHVEGGVSGIYNKATYLTQRREMMQWYADYLDALASNLPAPPKPG